MACRERLATLELLTADRIIYRPPARHRVCNATLHIANTSAAIRTIRLHQRAATAGATTANALFFDVQVPRNSVTTEDGVALSPNDVLSGSVSFDRTVTVHLYGELVGPTGTRR